MVLKVDAHKQVAMVLNVDAHKQINNGIESRCT